LIKEYRKKMGLTQEQLAEKLDISTRQFQRIEAGDATPGLKTLQKLVLVLNISDKDLGEYVRNHNSKK